MTQIVAAVTTYRKNKALQQFLTSYLQHGDWDLLHSLIICDDEAPTAKEVFEEFKPAFQGKLRYTGGSRKGVARNKNRGIRYFREHTEAEHLILFDDDIEFIGSGLEKMTLNAGWKHITGYLESETHFFKLFPPFGETENLWFCGGSQGMFLYYHRSVIDLVGYFPINLKSKYGFEHDYFSNQINRQAGFHPKYYALLKGCQHFFKSQQVPNDYTIPDVYANQQQYNRAISDMIREGTGLKNPDPGVDIEISV